jgi:hypothetical protein
MLYALCSMLYALCSMLYALCSMLYVQSMKNPEKVCQRMGLCSMLYALCLWKPTEASGSPGRPAEAHRSAYTCNKMTLLTIFYGFLDDFLQLYLFCFIRSTKFVYAVRSSSMQYKSLLPFLRGGGGGGGQGVCV